MCVTIGEDIFLFSYGEYVPACSAVDYKPLIERAEGLAKSDYPLLKEDEVVNPASFGVNGSALRNPTLPSSISTFGPSEGSARLVSLGEAVTRVGYGE